MPGESITMDEVKFNSIMPHRKHSGRDGLGLPRPAAHKGRDDRYSAGRRSASSLRTSCRLPSSIRPALDFGQAQRRRAQFLEAALELIAQQRFEHTTIEQIAAPVQVFSRTFLRYVPTKEDLIVAWVDDEFGALLHKLKERPLSEPPARMNKAAKCSP